VAGEHATGGSGERLPTLDGVEIRKPCVSRPSEHQAILPHKLGLELPRSVELTPPGGPM
jgi:hypothetical protein